MPERDFATWIVLKGGLAQVGVVCRAQACRLGPYPSRQRTREAGRRNRSLRDGYATRQDAHRLKPTTKVSRECHAKAVEKSTNTRCSAIAGFVVKVRHSPWAWLSGPASQSQGPSARSPSRCR